jgi:hypothetical protein
MVPVRFSHFLGWKPEIRFPGISSTARPKFVCLPCIASDGSNLPGVALKEPLSALIARLPLIHCHICAGTAKKIESQPNYPAPHKENKY